MSYYKSQKNSKRLQGYDYSAAAYYFITICTKERVCYFGEVQNGKMILSKEGKIVQEEWAKTQDLRKEMEVRLEVFCVMPNHFHAVVCFGNPLLAFKDQRLPNTNMKFNQFESPGKNLSAIVRGFKGACTRRIKTNINSEFQWQKSFHDHIIRDQESLIKIEEYILDNPGRWTRDMFYQ